MQRRISSCLGYAGFIYNDGLANPDAFEKKWRVSPDAWWKNIGEQPSLGADFMKPHFDQAFSAFCGRSGLRCNPGSYVENPGPTFEGRPSIDGFALGAGFGVSRLIFSVSGGMEFVFSAKSGEIGLVTYSSPPGISIGSGSSRKAYFALINNLNQLEDYAGGTWSVDGTASTPYLGVVGSRFWSSTPGGSEGWTIGYAPGARLSGSFGWSSYSQPWIKYDLTTNQVSFPQVEQIIQAFSGNK